MPAHARATPTSAIPAVTAFVHTATCAVAIAVSPKAATSDRHLNSAPRKAGRSRACGMCGWFRGCPSPGGPPAVKWWSEELQRRKLPLRDTRLGVTLVMSQGSDVLS
ncbi:hypothetical protein GCM10010412_025420 [Nonomuraea recticatena]|uniref:Secreted protein n=1 Tax=Nonomuraea recticatena TaxID=46178 RepID=A0ABP6E206_9ACTN